MRTLILLVCTATLWAVPARVVAQQRAAPTRSAVPSTPAQDTAIGAGIELHDQGKYHEAIARYQDVLAQSPDNMTALFELAFSYLAKKDFQKSLETAGRGTEYKSDLLAMFYDLIGSALDAMGQPQQAIESYKRGIELVPDASLLYYNMAVTYRETLKNDEEARRALKAAAAIDPAQAETHLMLGQLFQAGGYQTPALLALARFLIVAPGGRGALQAYGLWRAVLRGGIDMNAPSATPMPVEPSKTDEGDFAALDASLGASHLAAMAEQDKGKTEIEALVAQLDGILTRLAARDPAADRSTFVGTQYIPYFVELNQKNFVEPFVYWVSQRAPVPGVREWLDANQPRVREFLDWSAKYGWKP